MTFPYLENLNKIVESINEAQGTSGKWVTVVRSRMAKIETSEGVSISVHKEAGRWVFVENLHSCLSDNKTIKVSDSKDPRQIAKELQRRLLSKEYENKFKEKIKSDREFQEEYEKRKKAERGKDYAMHLASKIVSELNKNDGAEWGSYWLKDGIAVRRGNSGLFIFVILSDKGYINFKKGDEIVLSVPEDLCPASVACELAAIDRR